jgi:two-component system chemotaxis sensor kinase CheA
VVKTNIDQIGGSIDLKSTAGKGTTLSIKIPLTLAIVPALLVESAKERFAIPQSAVVELVRVNATS